MTIPSSSVSRYRPEIDGLRAFAVVAVIINHFNKDVLPGGYLGVDIFFVISGFVITSSLHNRGSGNGFIDFITGFYERRIKRLVPALSVFVLVATVAISLFNQYPKDSIRTGLSSLFGLSNLYLLKQSTDYFAQSTELNVFTHTWSLGVEEQFYLFFPLLVWYSGFTKNTHNSARNLFLLVTLTSVASYVLFCHLSSENLSAAYFLMPSRYWEMSAGCLVFIVIQKEQKFVTLIKKISPSLVVSAMILLMLFPFSFTPWITTSVVALVSILIITLTKKTFLFKVLTSKACVFLGLMSYSLYLWHWGIISVSRWSIGIHWWTIPIQIILIFLLAFISYRWIETPAREWFWFSKRWQTLLSGFAVLFVLSGGISIFSSARRSHLFLGLTNLSVDLGATEKPKMCNIFDHLPQADMILHNCGNFINDESPTLFLVGDSHAEQYSHELARLSEKKSINYVLLWGPSCMFPAGIIKWANQSCYNTQLDVEERILQIVKPGDIVIVANALRGYFDSDDGYFDQVMKPVDRSFSLQAYGERFIELSHSLRHRGVLVVFYIDGIRFADMNYDNAELCIDEWFRVVSKGCFSSKSEHQRAITERFPWAESWSEIDGNYVWSAIEYQGGCAGDVCSAGMYKDGNHFKEQESTRVFRAFLAETKLLQKS